MSIVTAGWGNSTITTSGWGGDMLIFQAEIEGEEGIRRNFLLFRLRRDVR